MGTHPIFESDFDCLTEMNEEIDIYADVDKIHNLQHDYENGYTEPVKMVSIYIGNLTWWTSDYDLEQQIRKNGIADLVEIKIYENASNGQSKGYALVHLGSESSAKLIMDKFPKIDLNGQKPIVTPANSSTHQQFENVVRRGRKTPEKESPQSRPPPQMPLGMPPTMVGLPPSMPPISGPPPVIPPPGVRPSFPPPQMGVPPPFHQQIPPRPPMPLPPPGFMPFPPHSHFQPPTLPIDPLDEEVMDKNKQISSSAIKRAVDDASNGNYSSAIETLLNAISSIKASKVSKDDRAKVMISSLQDCLHGIEEKSFGASSNSSSRDRKKRRDRSRDRSRSRDRDSKRSRNRSRSRERERRRSDYDDRDRR